MTRAMFTSNLSSSLDIFSIHRSIFTHVSHSTIRLVIIYKDQLMCATIIPNVKKVVITTSLPFNQPYLCIQWPFCLSIHTLHSIYNDRSRSLIEHILIVRSLFIDLHLHNILSSRFTLVAYPVSSSPIRLSIVNTWPLYRFLNHN